MLDVLIDKLKSLLKSRMLPVTIVYFLLVCTLIFRLFTLQIVKGEEYETSFSKSSSQERVIQATRGNIYDVKGRLLAYNVLSYNVTFLDTGEYTDSATLNAKILEIIRLLEKNGDQLEVDFNLSIDEKGNISFDGSEKEILRFKRDVFSHKKVDDLTEQEIAATAEEVFTYLQTSTGVNSLKFKISDQYTKDYTKQDAYKVMSLRYAMYLNNYTKYEPLEIATNVSDKTVAAVKEYSGDISGLDIKQTTTREYSAEYAECMAQVLGYTGKISDEAYQELVDSESASGYSKNDQVGKTGVEKQFDAQLHGTNGSDKVLLNQSKRVVEVIEGKQATPGTDIHLSIDAELQKNAYNMMEKELAGILLDKIHEGSATKVTVNGKEDIYIPAKAVYFALLDNGVIDISHFAADDATSVEQAVYDTFLSERKKVFKNIKSILDYSKNSNYGSLSDQEKDYVDYIYKMLVKNNVLMSSNYKDLNDENYTLYADHKISLGEFLQYALSQDNWVDRTIFSDADKFYNSEEIYNELLTYIIEQLSDDGEFSKMIYKTLVYNGKIQARQICLLLFDQNVLNYNKDDYAALKAGSKSPYQFIRSKISNLEITPGQLALDPCSGSVVITDPDTGKVEALVSYPGYDNNKLANKIDATYYSYLANTDAYPLLNRAIQQKTAPGSTFKMLTAFAGLEEGVIDTSTTFADPGYFDKVTPNPHCWKRSGHGTIGLETAIEVSCNVYFYNVGYRLGLVNGKFSNTQALTKLKKYAEEFGFGSKSGVELPNEAENQISNEQGIPSAIGQGTNNFTPVNLAKYITGLSNKGTVYDLSIIKDTESKVYNKVEAKDSTWNIIKRGNYKVVNSSANNLSGDFKGLDVKVAGKTGTAQENKNKPDHALFVSYAPYENPEVTMTVVIPNGYTSHNAAELAGNIYKYYFADDKTKKELENAGVSKPSDSSLSEEH
ncbi:MAG: penicillin-binding transpeptidase domain-containing protein [bacterium]|nr:penicillin-binding transpeptidase domain-containing protein [bacterium]